MIQDNRALGKDCNRTVMNCLILYLSTQETINTMKTQAHVSSRFNSLSSYLLSLSFIKRSLMFYLVTSLIFFVNDSLTAQPSKKYVRTYQTGVFLNGSIPFSQQSGYQNQMGFGDLKEAFSLTVHSRYRNKEYGILAPFPPGPRITVEVYDSLIFGKKSNDFVKKEGLLYGIRSYGDPNVWERESFQVENCLYGNRYNVFETPTGPVDAFGTMECPGFSRDSDDWKSNYYASTMEWLKRNPSPSNLVKPFQEMRVPVILRVTIEEDQPMDITNSSILDSYIPGIGKITNYFNFDEPQRREPFITKFKNNGADGTVTSEFSFIDDSDRTLFKDSTNSWRRPIDDKDVIPGVKFYSPSSNDCNKSTWPSLEVFKWSAKYEAGTVYENEVHFYLRTDDVKLMVEQCQTVIDPISGQSSQTNCNMVPRGLGEMILFGADSWDKQMYDLADNIGRIPRLLRRGIKDVYVNYNDLGKGDGCPLASNSIRISLNPQVYKYAEMPEFFLHESVHTTSDRLLVDFKDGINNGDSEWKEANKEDGRNYSEYVQANATNMYKEQNSEHFALYLWLRTGYFENRKFPILYPNDPTKAAREARKFRNQVVDFMPNRIYYYENFLLNKTFDGIDYNRWDEALYPMSDFGSVFQSGTHLPKNSARLANVAEKEAIKSVSFDDPAATGFTLYPNPNQGEAITLRFDGAIKGVYQVEIISIDGRVVLKKQVVAERPGELELTDLCLRNGIYLLKCYVNGGYQIERFVVNSGY